MVLSFALNIAPSCLVQPWRALLGAVYAVAVFADGSNYRHFVGMSVCEIQIRKDRDEKKRQQKLTPAYCDEKSRSLQEGAHAHAEEELEVQMLQCSEYDDEDQY